VASIDTNYRPSAADTITASLGYSRTRYSDEMIQGYDLREDAFGDTFLQLKYLHSVRGWWTDVHYSDFGEGFRADLGFMPRVDFREWRAAGARVWWGEEGDFHRRLAWGGAVRHRERQSGDLLEEDVETWVNLNGPKQSFVSVNLNLRNQQYNGVEFQDLLFAHTWFEIQATDDLNLTFHQDYGDWIDFDNTQPARRTLIQPGLRYNLGRHLLVRYNHTYTALDVEEGRLFRVHAPEARVIYQFNNRAFIRAVLQYTDIERDPSLYADEVDESTRDLFSQLLFTYKVNAQTAVYAGYSDTYDATQDYDLTQTSRTLFVKLGYAWVR
jgi:hypothetical protein